MEIRQLDILFEYSWDCVARHVDRACSGKPQNEYVIKKKKNWHALELEGQIEVLQ